MPDTTMTTKETPDVSMKTKETPVSGKGENIVFIAGKPIEIKATKLKYLRNGTANLYRLVEQYPIIDIVQLPVGAFGEGDDRDGDKALMDWLIAATDDEKLISENYDDLDAEIIHQILLIFKRVNRFVENDSKNGQSPREKE